MFCNSIGEIVLANDTVQSLLIAAGYLGCESIISAASEFIKQRINIENVIEVVQVAESLSCVNLRSVFCKINIAY